MKKTLILLSFVLFAVASMAQVSNGFEAFVADTTTNAETEYLVTANAVSITRDYAVTLTVVPTNESGTASVTAMPQGYDGTTWFDLETSATTVNNAGTVANAAYTYADAHYLQYRVKLVSTGTGETSFIGKIGLKRK